eukprot:GHVU01206804.1.p1 GENE.GHVU01206804.1~~GHVU01206804.1.p1  ORF type:complete len:231 (-),score=16.48 GHVU01206804.1:12-704(-)
MGELTEQGFKVGSFCSDSDSGIGRGRRILALRHIYIIFSACQSHIISCVVAAVVRNVPDFQQKLAAVTSFINKALDCSAKWLPVIAETISATYGRRLQVLQMVKSRWNTGQAACASILRVRSGLRLFVISHKSHPQFPKEFLVAEQESFWEATQELEAVFRPLALASFVLQKDDITLAQVIGSWLTLYSCLAKYCGSHTVTFGSSLRYESYHMTVGRWPLAALKRSGTRQ